MASGARFMSQSGTQDGLVGDPAIRWWGASESPGKILGEYRTERALRWRFLNAPAAERGALYVAAFEEVLRRSSEDLESRRLLIERSRTHAAATARALRRYMGRNTHVVEMGPGDGRLAVLLAASARRVTMVDVRDTLARMSDRPSTLELLVTDGTGAPLPPASADLVFADQLIEHLHPADAEAIHRDVFAALRPGGAFICYSPNRLLVPHDLTRYFDCEAPAGLHLREYSLRELAALLRRLGFARVRPLVGARSLWLPAPLWLLGLVEDGLAALSPRQRRRVARAPGLKPVLRLLLGARVVAWKPR
jgi:SAM-dependent methyltransferase